MKELLDGLVVAIESAGGRVDTEGRPGFTLDKADHLDSYARYDKTGAGNHIIAVNPHLTLSLLLLIENVAHEMVHLKQDMKGRRPYKATKQHNKEFFRMVRLVCRDLGLDPQRF